MSPFNPKLSNPNGKQILLKLSVDEWKFVVRCVRFLKSQGRKDSVHDAFRSMMRLTKRVGLEELT